MCSVSSHMNSIRVELTCVVIAHYCVIKWLLPFMSCSSHYFNGMSLSSSGFPQVWGRPWLIKHRAAGVSLWIWQKKWCLTCNNDSFAFKNFPTEVIFLSKRYTTWCCREASKPNAHSSGLTRSRCLANETSYWLVFMFFSTFLFTSSTCLPCCGCSCAECLFSWSRSAGTWPAETGTCGIPLLSSIGPSSSEPLMAGDCSSITLA